MKLLEVDDKWSVGYDPQNNDRPIKWFRYGQSWLDFEQNNAVVGLFYALLNKDNE